MMIFMDSAFVANERPGVAGEVAGRPLGQPARFTSAVLLALCRAFAHLFQSLVNAEAAGFLARREFFER